MDLTRSVDGLKAGMQAAAAVAGDEVVATAGRLVTAAEPALRLVLLDLLGEAADELTTSLGGAVVELRVRGGDPELVATAPTAAGPEARPEPDADEGTSRLTLRLPERLKERAEAAAGEQGVSTNTWLVRAVAAALDPRPQTPFPGGTGPGPRRLTGFGRS